jgi:hypothetical protein
MAAERARHVPIVVRDGAAPLGVPLPPEVMARRRRVIPEVRRLGDAVVGTVPGTIAELLSEEQGDSAVNG